MSKSEDSTIESWQQGYFIFVSIFSIVGSFFGLQLLWLTDQMQEL
jgi:hypothetical protein